MAAPSGFPRRGPPELARAADEISRSMGGSMFVKLAVVAVATFILIATPQFHSFALPIGLTLLAAVFAYESIWVVPQQSAWVVERWGRFHVVLEPGLNWIWPFIDRVAYRHSLKEVPMDVPEQVCITKDNTQLAVDGLIYYQVTDPRLASYGTSDYVTAIVQLAQTTLRSEVGKMELDQSLQSRDVINRSIVAVLDEGEKQAAILTSEGQKQSAINKAQGEATALRVVADATAAAVNVVAEAIGKEGGLQAANLKVAELYIGALGNLAKTNNTMLVPTNLSDVASVVASAMTVLDRTRAGAKPA